MFPSLAVCEAKTASPYAPEAPVAAVARNPDMASKVTPLEGELITLDELGQESHRETVDITVTFVLESSRPGFSTSSTSEPPALPVAHNQCCYATLHRKKETEA